jgi:tRNA threonylcarbamoyl adenosine modification protein YjeE
VSLRLDEAGLTERAAELGRELPPGAVVWLEGDLGAGKSTFARALVRALGVSGPAPSPTYALVHHYDGRRGPVYHVDCYRLTDPDQAHDLDWETLQRGDALLIEWPERAGAWAPRPTFRVRLAHDPDPALRSLALG